MSNLVAIAYPDQSTADEVMATLGRLQDERSIKHWPTAIAHLQSSPTTLQHWRHVRS